MKAAKLPFKRSSFSKSQLVFFALVFAVIGGYIILRSFASPNPNLSGDLNNDNIVNVSDLSILLGAYGTTNTNADINLDGQVTILDLSILLNHYGSTYTPPPPPPAPLPPPPPPSGGGTTLWTGDFETGDLSGWSNQSCPTGVIVVTSPVRAGSYATKFTVDDNSIKANCPNVPTANPRAQLYPQSATAHMLTGDDRYVGFSTYFPANFPTTTSWFQVAEVYGPPFGGSPTMGFDIVGNNMVLDTGMARRGEAWTSATPIAKGTGWEDIVIHFKLSTDPAVGFIEIWRNSVLQTLNNGQTRFYYTTVVPGVNDTNNTIILNQYRNAAVPMGTVILYHDEARVGTSYASVAPN